MCPLNRARPDPILPGVNLGALRSRNRRAVGLAAAVLTLGLAGGAAASAGLCVAADDAREASLQLRAAAVRSAFETALQRYVDTTDDLVAAATTPELTGAVQRLTEDRLPGAHRVLVVDADRRVLAQRTTDGSNPPATDRLDPEPELARAMALAEKYGQPVTSLAHVLPDDAGRPLDQQRPGFVLTAPVRDGTFRGWVIVSVRASDLLAAAMQAGRVAGVVATLTETADDGIVREVADWSPEDAPADAGSPTINLPIVGNSWHLVVRPATPLIGLGRQLAAPLTMGGAVLLSAIMAALALAAAGRRVVSPGVTTAVPTLSEADLAGFAASAGHQLQAPLHSITGYAEMLLDEAGPGLDDESRGMLRRVDDAARRALILVDELIAYASAGDTALNPEPVEASLLALDVAAAHLPGPTIEIGELPAIAGDAALLRQVLDQMVANAARFVRHGVPARIGIGARELPGGWWRLEVTDRGIGVPEEQRARIFAPFHRSPAAESYPGSGLGLAVCARIVALHGGEIGVEGNPGGGSVFWFTVAGAELGTREPVLA